METMAMSMMPIGMVVYGMLYDTLPATIILPVTSVIIIIISLVMLRSSILKEAHPEYYEKAALPERVANTVVSVEKQNSQLKGRNGFPLQATCFPVGERRIASSATAPFRVLPVSLSHGSQVAFHFNPLTF